MYRTYRNLYRIRPSISSIGQGKGRIRLPRGMQITLDTAILFVVFLVISRIFIAPILAMFFGPYKWIYAIMISGFVAYKAAKIDPGGKPITNYLYDLIKFVLRTRYHDGWDKKDKGNSFKMIKNSTQVAFVDDGMVASLPAEGRITEVELLVPLGLEVKGGLVRLKNKKNGLETGLYSIKKGKIEACKSPPSLKRNSLSL